MFNESTEWYQIDPDDLPVESTPNVEPPTNPSGKGLRVSRNKFGAGAYHTHIHRSVSVATQDSISSEKFYVVIYAVVVGGSTCLLLLVVLVIFLVKKVKEQRKTIEVTNEEIDEFMLGIAAEKAQAKGINGLFILPYDTSLEIPKSDVTFRKTCKSCGH